MCGRYLPPHSFFRYKDTAEYRQQVLELQELDRINSIDLVTITSDLQNRSPYKASWIRQIRALLWRCWLSQARDTNVFAVRIFQTLIIAFLIGFIYLQQEYNQKGVQNINGALFLFLTNMSFSNFFTVLNVNFCTCNLTAQAKVFYSHQLRFRKKNYFPAHTTNRVGSLEV